MVILRLLLTLAVSWRMFELDNILENGKPIALLFGTLFQLNFSSCKNGKENA